MDLELHLFIRDKTIVGVREYCVMRRLDNTETGFGLQRYETKCFPSAEDLLAFLTPMRPPVPQAFLRERIGSLKLGEVGASLTVERAWAELVGL
jgi:hypothetical protein